MPDAALRNFPAFVDDVSASPGRRAAFAQGWDAILANWFTTFDGIEGGGFYDPRADTTPGEPDTASVAWDAFPRPITTWFTGDADPDLKRWQSAETLRPRLFGGRPLRRVVDRSLAEPVTVFYRQQDEYCEWHVDRDEAGHITRVSFTCEGPEYWRFLAMGSAAFFPQKDERSDIVEGDIDLVADLYRRYVDPSVIAEDLLWPYDVAAFDPDTRIWGIYGHAGTYNRFNRWTTTHGAMHLTHPANTLHGVFVVAGRGAVLREDKSGAPIDDSESVVCCSGFGEPNRSSDPSIGGGINSLVGGGLSVSLADPVGLYIAGINTDTFTGPAGEPAVGAWRVDRGDPDRQMILRATFAAPDGAGFSVDEMRANGTPISFGGQIADAIQMRVTALAKQRQPSPPPRQACVTKCCENPDRAGVVTVIEPPMRCARVDWAALAPASGPTPAPVAEELDGAGVVLDVTLDLGSETAAPTTRG